jgi:hypothetical protein
MKIALVVLALSIRYVPWLCGCPDWRSVMRQLTALHGRAAPGRFIFRSWPFPVPRRPAASFSAF